MGYPYKKIDIEGVGCFTVPKPVWDLLQDIDTIRDAVAAERDAARVACRMATAEAGARLEIMEKLRSERDAARAEVAFLHARLDDCREELFEIERDE